MTPTKPPWLEAVALLLVEDGWEVFESHTNPVLRVPVHGEDGTLICQVEARDNGRHLVARVAFPPHLRDAELRLVDEYVSRARRGLSAQRFVLDPDEGTLALEVCVDLHALPLTPPEVRQVLVDLLSAADRHLDSVMRLVYDPVAAIDSIDSVRRMSAW